MAAIVNSRMCFSRHAFSMSKPTLQKLKYSQTRFLVNQFCNSKSDENMLNWSVSLSSVFQHKVARGQHMTSSLQFSSKRLTSDWRGKLLQVNPISMIPHSCHSTKKSNSKKSKNKRASAEEGDSDDDGSDSDDGEDAGEDDWNHERDGVDDAKRDWKDLKMNVPSLRVDAVLSAGLGVSRKKIEDAFLNAKLRHNGKKVLKKSKQVVEGDVLDLLRDDKPAATKDGQPWMVVMRVEVTRIKSERSSSDKIPVKLKRWKHLELPREK